MRSLVDTLLQRCHGKKAILLDLDNTLYDYAPAHQSALETCWHYAQTQKLFSSRKAFIEAYHAARHSTHKTLKTQAARHSRLIYFKHMLEKQFSKINAVPALTLESLYWNAFLKVMRKKKWVDPFLKECRARNQKIAIVTNLTLQIQLKKIIRLKLEPYVDALYASEEAGVEKPSRALYQIALKALRIPGQKAILIDDESSNDTRPWMDFFIAP